MARHAFLNVSTYILLSDSSTFHIMNKKLQTTQHILDNPLNYRVKDS